MKVCLDKINAREKYKKIKRNLIVLMHALYTTYVLAVTLYITITKTYPLAADECLDEEGRVFEPQPDTIVKYYGRGSYV